MEAKAQPIDNSEVPKPSLVAWKNAQAIWKGLRVGESKKNQKI
jgi:hypothetical protein